MDDIESTVLTLTDIIRDIAEPQDEKRVRSTLSRYLGEDGVGELLGATGKTCSTFSPPSVPVFAARAAAFTVRRGWGMIRPRASETRARAQG